MNLLGEEPAGAGAPRRSGWRLGFAAAGVMLAAADTYVVVLALPSIMSDIGLSLDHLEAATPIISGFLLGYVALLPLLGRLSDILGRAPVFAGCLLVFAFGSLVTSSAQDLTGAVVGRALQGAGGGGLVPVTLAIVADLWPAGRRGVPLGVIGGVQELGSVLGPLYGAAILSFSTWRLIFWLNLPLAALLGAGFVLSRPAGLRPAADAGALSGPSEVDPEPPARRRPVSGHRMDLTGTLLLAAGVVAGGLAVAAPGPLAESEVWGVLWAPLAGSSAWTTPLAVLALVAAALSIAWGSVGEGRPAAAPPPAPPPRHLETGRRPGWGPARRGARLRGGQLLRRGPEPGPGGARRRRSAPPRPGGRRRLHGARNPGRQRPVATRRAARPRGGRSPAGQPGDRRRPDGGAGRRPHLRAGHRLQLAARSRPGAAPPAGRGSGRGRARRLPLRAPRLPADHAAGDGPDHRDVRPHGRVDRERAGARAPAQRRGAGRLWPRLRAGHRPRSTRPSSVPSPRPGTGSPRPWWWSPGWSGCWSASPCSRPSGSTATTRRPRRSRRRRPSAPAHPLSCAAYNTLAQHALLDELRTIFLAAAVCTAAAGPIGVAMLRRRHGRDPGAMAAALGA